MNREAWKNARIGIDLDHRRKLDDKDKAHIKQLHKLGYGVREISRMYEKVCSRRLIQFVLYPERLQKLQDVVKREKRWNKYYSTEKRKLYMRVHRSNIKTKYANKI